jgi:hypothetical protein
MTATQGFLWETHSKMAHVLLESNMEISAANEGREESETQPNLKLWWRIQKKARH